MVYIIVLNWNNSEDTISCISTLLKQNYIYFRIVLVDNDSTDDSLIKILAFLKKSCQNYLHLSESESYLDEEIHTNKITVISATSNKGYAGGNNIGIEYALQSNDCKYIWVLNNDTEVESNSLSLLVSEMERDKEIGILGSKLVYYHNKNVIQGLGGKYLPWRFLTQHIASNHLITSKYDNDTISKQIDYIIGAALFVKAEVFKTVGLLDEQYFLYFEELDICLRARKHNYKLKTITDSIVYHKEGATISKEKNAFSEYHYLRSNKLFIRKFYPQTLFLYNMMLIAKIANRVRRGQFDLAKANLKVLLGIKYVNSKT